MLDMAEVEKGIVGEALSQRRRGRGDTGGQGRHARGHVKGDGLQRKAFLGQAWLHTFVFFLFRLLTPFPLGSRMTVAGKKLVM